MLAVQVVARKQLFDLIARSRLLAMPRGQGTWSHGPDWQVQLRILYNLALSSDEQKIVQITDKMLTLMSYHGQSHVVQIKNLNVGVHPQNRGGKLLADREVHSNGAGVAKAGFAMEYCKPDRAVCFECDTTSMQTQSWTCRLSEPDMFPKTRQSISKLDP